MPADFARQMARRDIVFQRPTPFWQNGLLIGNGDFGGAVFGGGAASAGVVGVTLSKVDVWDERYDRGGHRYHTLAELRQLIARHSGTEEGRQLLRTLEPGAIYAPHNWIRETYPYAYAPPTPKPCGLLRLEPGAVFGRFTQRLSLHRGEVTFTLGNAARGASVAVWMDAHHNVLVAEVRRHGRFDHPITIELARYVDEQLGEPELGADGAAFWHRYAFPDGFAYALYGIVAEGAVAQTAMGTGEWHDTEARTNWVPEGGMRVWETAIHAPERTATLTLAPGVAAATVVLAVATTKERADPLAAAEALARDAARDVDGRRAAHRRWWDGFWRKSSLTLSDRMVETLWYQGLYALACQSRGRMPPSLVGPGYYLPHAGWRGLIHTDFNIQMMYWPTFAANHLELAQVYYDFFTRHLETIRAETLETWGIDGLKFPGLTDGNGRELGYIPCRMWQSSSAWCAEAFWWGYRYTLDEGFLRDTAYPVLRGVAQYYRAFAQRGDDGTYHITPSTAPEQPPWWAADPAIDIALIRTHLRATLDAAERLELDADLRPGWRDLLDNLPDIPNNGEVFLDERDAAPDKRLGHIGLLCTVFSAGEVGLGAPPTAQAMARRTLDGLLTRTSRKVVGFPFAIPTWNDDCNWPYLLAITARLGLAEQTRAYLYDFGLLQHLKPNGLFAFDTPLTAEQRETRWGMPDSGHCLTAAISEMVLQSYEGMIRVAPALPADWDARFTGFRTVGAFEVDGEIRGGQAQSLTIRSLKGGRCRVVLPWAGGLRLHSGGQPVAYTVEDGILAFETQPGAEYALAPAQPAPARAPRFGPNDAAPLRYDGPAYMGDVPPVQRLAVWLGLPRAGA